MATTDNDTPEISDADRTEQEPDETMPPRTEPHVAGGNRSTRLGLARRASAAFVVGALVLGCGYLGFRQWESERQDDSRDTAMAVGRQYALDLTSYDYRTFDETITKVTANSTQKFADEYTKVGEVLRDAVTQAQASASASIVQAGVVEADSDSALLVYFIDQTVTNTATSEPRVDRNRLQIGLLRSDRGWLLDDVQLL